MRREISRTRIQLAWGLAILVDALQILSGPITLSLPMTWIIGAGLDIMTMILMWALVGWHWVFLPSFVVEVIPIAEIAPAWTAAVFIATRRRREPAAGSALPSPGAEPPKGSHPES